MTKTSIHQLLRTTYIITIVGGLMVNNYSYALFGIGESDSSMTSFVPAGSTDNTSVELAQHAISQLMPSPSNSSISLDTSISLISHDIMVDIKESTDKKGTLSAHLINLHQAQSYIQQQITAYQNTIKDETLKMDECLTTKKEADANTITAINENKESQWTSLTEKSIEAALCESKHRVALNVANLISDKYQTVLTQITRKIDLLELHQDAIITYPEVIIDTTILSELQDIASQF